MAYRDDWDLARYKKEYEELYTENNNLIRQVQDLEALKSIFEGAKKLLADTIRSFDGCASTMKDFELTLQQKNIKRDGQS